MSEVVYTDGHVFDDGPPMRLQRSLGLVKPEQPRVVRRALLAAAVAWIPLALLTTAQTISFADASANWFFSDFSIHARNLIAVPVLILAEVDCIPRLEHIVGQFVDAGLIANSDQQRYRNAVESTRRLLKSGYADVAVPLVAYLIAILLIVYVPLEWIPPWQQTVSGNLSLAGWWNLLISLPLLLILLLGWLWRLALWGRFLGLMAALDLQLLPSHPDSAGGLRFLFTSLRGFRLISFALGAIMAGVIADHILYNGADLFSFKTYAIVLMSFILILFAGPLTVFIRRLRETRRRGVFEYGALANRLGREFEAKWLHAENYSKEMLSAPDFSATTDYFSVAANVYEMRALPFRARDLIEPVGFGLMPILATTLLQIPLQVVVKNLVKLFF